MACADTNVVIGNGGGGGGGGGPAKAVSVTEPVRQIMPSASVKNTFLIIKKCCLMNERNNVNINLRKNIYISKCFV